MSNSKLLQDELVEAFIEYQWRLDNPMPTPTETWEQKLIHFHADRLFHNKVLNLTQGVYSIVSKYIK